MALIVRPKLAQIDILPKVRDNKIVFYYLFRMLIVNLHMRRITLFLKYITTQVIILTGVMNLLSTIITQMELCGLKLCINKLLMISCLELALLSLSN
jgi:hypothetical protein